MKKFIFCFFLLQLCLSEGFIKSEQTNVISILNDAAYSSADTAYGSTEIDRVNNRLSEIQAMFPSTKENLQNISAYLSTDQYSIFKDETTKQAYVVIRGTVISKGVDLYNDAQMFFEQTPQRTQEIQNLMSGVVSNLANDGYTINVSAHSLGGSLALFACANNQWVSHCEVHNPYLDDAIISKLKPMIEDNPNMAGKILIQRTNGDLVSSFFVNTTLGNVAYSSFDIPDNVKGLNSHSCLTLFAEAYLSGDSEVAFEGISFSVSEKFLNLCKEKFGNYIALTNQCMQAEYYSFQSLSCLTCPLKKACKDSFFGPYNCPSQKYASTSGECLPCSSGKYTDTVGQSACFTCPQGNKCIDGKKIPCPPGSFTRNLGGDSCQACSSGTFQSKQGQTFCNSCPTGSYCPTTEKDPIPCQPGTRNRYSEKIECLKCPTGSYQTESGQTDCWVCPTGHYCPSSDTKPIPCEPGTYQSNSYQTECLKCPTGSYQTESGKNDCWSCPTGYYCPNSDKKPIPCPPGTYNSNIQKTDCLKCPAGSYQTESGKTDCWSCPIGHQCPISYQNPIPCPPGTYNKYILKAECPKCPKGSYQTESGQTDCWVCPAGNYCPTSDKNPIPCPSGTYNPYKQSNDLQDCLTCKYSIAVGASSCIQAGFLGSSLNNFQLPS